jgi:hypothetical protein
MKLLNLDSGDEAATPSKKKSKWLKIGIGLSALVLIPTIGSTLAGTITIGSGSVEFGQGLVTTAACDPIITLAPTSTLTTDSVPVFEILAIRLSDIDVACEGKTFRLSAYDSLGDEVSLCDIWSDYADIVYGSSGSTSTCGGTSTIASLDGFEFSPSYSVLAGRVATITIESME